MRAGSHVQDDHTDGKRTGSGGKGQRPRGLARGKAVSDAKTCLYSDPGKRPGGGDCREVCPLIESEKKCYRPRCHR
jgi:hypothetical protein